jgi:molybdate transport system ATP-binding protein
VTHDPVEATMLADRLVVLEDGRVTQSGTPAEIRDVPRSRYAGNLVGVNTYRGRLVRGREGEGRVSTDEGSIVVPWPRGIDEGRAVTAIVRPTDVTLSLEPPESSARNVFRGAVRSVASDGERARVRLATEPPLVAEVTPASVERLGLRDGVEVWASFKAVEVEIVLA